MCNVQILSKVYFAWKQIEYSQTVFFKLRLNNFAVSKLYPHYIENVNAVIENFVEQNIKRI